MDALEALIRDLPDQAAGIRQRFWRDPRFRDVCEDYRDAEAGACSSSRPAATDAPRVDEYRQLVAELLAEAAGMLRKGNLRSSGETADMIAKKPSGLIGGVALTLAGAHSRRRR